MGDLVFSTIAALVGLLCFSLQVPPWSRKSELSMPYSPSTSKPCRRGISAALERTITSAEQLTLILPNGVQTSTRQAYVDFHKQFFAEKTWTIQFETVSRTVGTDFAVLTTKSLYQDVVDGKPYRSRSWVTFTFQKESGQWRLIHDQNTRLPPEQQ